MEVNICCAGRGELYQLCPVGLEGSTIDGMAFTLIGGRATWDLLNTSNIFLSPYDFASKVGIALGSGQYRER